MIDGPNQVRIAEVAMPTLEPGEVLIGYVGYPFQNKRRKCCVVNLARDVDKEEKIGAVVITRAFLWNSSPKWPPQRNLELFLSCFMV